MELVGLFLNELELSLFIGTGVYGFGEALSRKPMISQLDEKKNHDHHIRDGNNDKQNREFESTTKFICAIIFPGDSKRFNFFHL